MKMAILQKASPMIDKAKFILNKRSPEIWLGAGIVAIVGGTVWACYATRKADRIMDERENDISYLDKVKKQSEDLIQEAHESGETLEDEDLPITMEEYNKERAKVTLRCAGDLVKAYAPSVILISGGIAMIINGHYILSKRNAALLTAYTALDDAFTKYRNRVSERFGHDVEEELYTGKTYATVTDIEVDENGKKHKVKNKVPVVTTSVSPYARFFGEGESSEWTSSPSYNHTFLVCQQNAANDLLRSRAKPGKRGWVFLNEVYHMLGIEECPTGAICGWLTPLEGEEPEGDSVIDFGIVEGNEDGSILLDFNCQGMIYDQI